MDDDVCESRRSKLVPYGLLSSSFHMMTRLRCNFCVEAAGEAVGHSRRRRGRMVTSCKLQQVGSSSEQVNRQSRGTLHGGYGAVGGARLGGLASAGKTCYSVSPFFGYKSRVEAKEQDQRDGDDGDDEAQCEGSVGCLEFGPVDSSLPDLGAPALEVQSWQKRYNGSTWGRRRLNTSCSTT